MEVFNRTPEGYEPLSFSAMNRILEVDSKRRAWGGGMAANVNRFYLYLTQNGSDVQVRTVAVKAPKRGADPVAKEVACASVDDPWIHVRDLALAPMAGYAVDWTPQGFGVQNYWSYEGRWESEPWALRCSWKVNAPVVNPELLKRTRRFRYCAWEPKRGQILDFLKIYAEHPEIELLIKSGLGAYSTKVSVLRKLKKDRNFRQFFMRNAEEIKLSRWPVPVIQKAYSKGISFAAASRAIEARREFYNLPRCIDAEKASDYAHFHRLRNDQYVDYLRNCETLGLDLADTKVSFPKQFLARQRAVQDRIDELQAKKDAAKNRKLNKRLAAIADELAENLAAQSDSGTYRVVIPRTAAQFAKEGRALKNCLGQGYASRMARGELVVVFVRRSRRPNEAFVAVSYDPKKGRIEQCYAVQNSKPPKAVQNFIDRVFDGIGKEQLEVAA
jgi:hypothetical protein